ncbi:MAG: GSCFA domain-containing protein [Lentisphaeria bacterium]|nr:GSCFA domain-containing protein [Lentisphaeria bacterium]
MANYQTEIKLPQAQQVLDFDSAICSLGSCFSENFVNHVAELGMTVSSNPGGIVYNAQSMFMIFEAVCNRHIFSESDFFLHQGLWKSWLHHGDFNSETIDEIIRKTNQAADQFYLDLQACDVLLLTPSTSVVYQQQDSGSTVANCHRVANNAFNRRVLSVIENFTALDSLVNLFRSVNPTALVVFTLSPVRHFPGDLSLNSQSKANLLSAIHQVTSGSDRGVCYFPSYEIMMDELRDYRFYKADMLHPSELAQGVIFRKFIETYFTATALESYPKRMKEAKFKNHRPRNEQ